jgi:flavin reductase (DIM6/NTAB) family NADH-FMN oxidoreductase RutF
MTDPDEAGPPTSSRRAALAATVATLAGAAAPWPASRSEAAAPLAPAPRPALPFAPTLAPAVEAAKKNAFILIPYGLYVLGVAHDGRLHAGTVNWVMQCAYKRPQFTLGLRRPGEFGLGAGPASDALYLALRAAGRLSLSFLGNDQADVARAFMTAPSIVGDRINGAPFRTALTGAPILSAAPAWFEASVDDTMDSADHTLFLCTVINAGNTVERPLLMDRDATARPRGWLPDSPAS